MTTYNSRLGPAEPANLGHAKPTARTVDDLKSEGLFFIAAYCIINHIDRRIAEHKDN